MKTFRRRGWLGALLAIAAMTAGCGSSSSNPTGPITMTATNFQFSPSTLTVAPAANIDITFVNSGTVAHSFTAPTLNIDTPVQPGATEQINFSAPRQSGTFTFHCSFHSNMTGLITVTAASGTPGRTAPTAADGGGGPGYAS